jgi:hypothetical protein
VIGDSAGQLDRQAAFADAGRAGKGEQAGAIVGQGSPQSCELRVAAEQRRGWHRHGGGLPIGQYGQLIRIKLGTGGQQETVTRGDVEAQPLSQQSGDLA